MHGGCACARIRYDADITRPDAYLCHCRMCQRASGAVSLALTTLPKSSVTWHAEPDWYASSAIARRPFCATCGTALGFEYLDSDQCDLTVASFDEPGFFGPTMPHFGAESLHEAWLDTSALARVRSDEYAPLVARWEAKCD